MQEYTVSFNFTLHVDGPLDPDVESSLQHIIYEDYSDGRYAFSRELLVHAVNQVIQDAYAVVASRNARAYPHYFEDFGKKIQELKGNHYQITVGSGCNITSLVNAEQNPNVE